MDKDARIRQLENALLPFANAGWRVRHFESPRNGENIVAISDGGNMTWELHSKCTEMTGETEDKLLNIDDLIFACEVMRN